MGKWKLSEGLKAYLKDIETVRDELRCSQEEAKGYVDGHSFQIISEKMVLLTGRGKDIIDSLSDITDAISLLSDAISRFNHINVESVNKVLDVRITQGD